MRINDWQSKAAHENGEGNDVRTWTFFARILPERVPLTLHQTLQGTVVGAIIGEYTFRVLLHASQAIVEMMLKRDDVDLLSLRNAVVQHIRTVTDLLGYLQGCCFDVEVISAVCKETNDMEVFGIDIPVLAQKRKDRELGKLEKSLLNAVGGNVTAQMVLADFREAMRMPINTGFYCYRAIEAMMQSMKSAPSDLDSPAWQLLRDRLRVNRSAIDQVKQHADFPRHGKVSEISDAERAKVFNITDEIIERYLQYVERECKPLRQEEFPPFNG
jgi:hypothetical protein